MVGILIKKLVHFPTHLHRQQERGSEIHGQFSRPEKDGETRIHFQESPFFVRQGKLSFDLREKFAAAKYAIFCEISQQQIALFVPDKKYNVRSTSGVCKFNRKTFEPENDGKLWPRYSSSSSNNKSGENEFLFVLITIILFNVLYNIVPN
jgi:hypothetical protein